MSGVQGPGDHPSKPNNPPKQIETGIGKTYTEKKAPEFKKWMVEFFGPQVTPQTVSAFEQNMMKMIQNTINRAKKHHKKVQQEIQERIKEQ